MAGTVIAASLITGVNSDLPGLVSAQVTRMSMIQPPGATCFYPKARG
jgi:type IV secretion system protein VirB10